MGNYWLLKTEPDCWSWDNQTTNKGLSVWDGVRNHQAQKAMRNMVEGDLCFFYHTGKLKEVCGIVRVVKTFYPDPTDDTGKWGAVDVEEVLPMKSNITLAQMKEDDEIADFLMFRQPRLSVVPVEENVWTRVCIMGEVEPPLLESSENAEGKVHGATSAKAKGVAEPKVAEKQNKKKVAGSGKKADREREELAKFAEKPSRKAKAKTTVVVKEDESKTGTGKKLSSVRSKTGVNGGDVGKIVQPAMGLKKRGRGSKPLPDEEEEDVPSARATKKRGSQGKSVSV